MQLATAKHELLFKPVPLSFQDAVQVNIFAHKNNRSVTETVAHRRYAHLAPDIHHTYADALDQPLGIFLLKLKTEGDPFYRRFLNKYGDATFCSFSIHDLEIIKQQCLYIFTVQNNVRYIGKSNDTFGKRINQGSGRIHPKNCYLDGQATNCHLNALVAEYRSAITFYVHTLTDAHNIGELERHLIQEKQPEWNTALKAIPK